MPAILDRLVNQLKAKGVKDPYPMAVAQLQKHGILEKGSDSQLTRKGAVRNAMSAEQRAVDRAIKYGGGKRRPADYKYDPKTNLATLKRR